MLLKGRERYGVVWAETRSARATGDGITQVNRVGIRLYLSVGPGGPPAANFKIDSVAAKRSPDGHPIVLATVHNTGGRALDMNGTLLLRDGPGGLSAGPYPAELGVSLAIGDTETVRIVLDKRLPAGPWHARVKLRSGLLSRTAAATITFPGTEASSSWPRLVIIGLLGLIGLLLAITALLIARRRRRGPPVTHNDHSRRTRARHTHQRLILNSRRSPAVGRSSPMSGMSSSPDVGPGRSDGGGDVTCCSSGDPLSLTWRWTRRL